jgi:hypothetical protein
MLLALLSIVATTVIMAFMGRRRSFEEIEAGVFRDLARQDARKGK